MFYCKCLGKNFSDKEHEDLIKRHLTCNTVYATYGKFKYNLYSVCLNPNIRRYNNPGVRFLEIRTSESEGGWSYGYDFETNIEHYYGGSVGVSYKVKNDINVYKTEEEAVYNAVKKLIFLFRKNNMPDNSVKALEKELSKELQLSLF